MTSGGSPALVARLYLRNNRQATFAWYPGNAPVMRERQRLPSALIETSISRAAPRRPRTCSAASFACSRLTSAHVGAAVAQVRAPLPGSLGGRHRHHLRRLVLDGHPGGVRWLAVHPGGVRRLGLHGGRVLLLIRHAWVGRNLGKNPNTASSVCC